MIYWQRSIESTTNIEDCIKRIIVDVEMQLLSNIQFLEVVVKSVKLSACSDDKKPLIKPYRI